MRFLETSAKEADNVETLFMEIAKELTQQAKENELITSRYSDSGELGPGSDPSESNFNCCKMV